MKKYLFLLTSLLLISPSLKVNNNDSMGSHATNGVVERDCCTFVYVGKQVSEDGIPIIARCTDAVPTCETNLVIYKRDALANKTFVGRNNYSYTFPNHTAKCVMAPMNTNVNWGYLSGCGINEYGVAMSATLTCYTNQTARGADDFVKNGIGEDSIIHSVLPVIKSAKEGAKLLVDIVQDSNRGNNDANAVLLADQKEVWYVEMYTGHQAVAVKLPEDKMFVLGNEFGLKTLTPYSDVIKSEELESLPEREGFAKKDEDGNLDLFATYAKPLNDTDTTLTDKSHRRTWRGLNLYGSEDYRGEGDFGTYNRETRYDFMFTPEVKKKLNVNDVIEIFRDRFDNIIENEKEPNHEDFLNDLKNNKLRTIACDRSANVHILKVNPNANQSFAATMWLTLSPALYAPFVPISAAIADAADPYLYVNPVDGYSDKSAYWVYKTLNTLGLMGDEFGIEKAKRKYPNFNGKLLIESLNAYQDIWEQEYKQIFDHALKMKDKSQRNAFLTNYCTKVQKEALKLARDLTDDCLLYFMNVNILDPNESKFYPLVDLKEYTHKFGYSYKKTSDGAQISKDDKTYTIAMPSGVRGDYGQIKCNDEVLDDKLTGQYKDGHPYIEFKKATEFLRIDTIAPVKFSDYLSKSNLPWLLPTIIVPSVVIGGGLAFYFLYWKKRLIAKAASSVTK